MALDIRHATPIASPALDEARQQPGKPCQSRSHRHERTRRRKDRGTGILDVCFPAACMGAGIRHRARRRKKGPATAVRAAVLAGGELSGTRNRAGRRGPDVAGGGSVGKGMALHARSQGRVDAWRKQGGRNRPRSTGRRERVFAADPKNFAGWRSATVVHNSGPTVAPRRWVFFRAFAFTMAAPGALKRPERDTDRARDCACGRSTPWRNGS